MRKMKFFQRKIERNKRILWVKKKQKKIKPF